ncbi:MAG: hypothetical protein JSR17_06840 [Proteobacteria bacterium]|nr:hypothetical protein [Pseudomonadota bacterium]
MKRGPGDIEQLPEQSNLKRADEACKTVNLKEVEQGIKSLRLSPKRFAKYFGLIVAAIYWLLCILAISRSTNSTAAIGYIFIPVTALIVFCISAFIGFWIGVIVRGILDRSYRYNFSFVLAFVIVIPIILYFASMGLEIAITYRDVNRISLMNSAELDDAFLNRPKWSLHGYDIYYLAAIAQNPNSNSKLLDRIAHLDHPQINDRIGSIFNLTYKNTKGLAVIRLVEQNPNVSVNTLEFLTDSTNYYVLGDIAANKKLSVECLRKLYAKSQDNSKGYLIEWGLKNNPNTSPDILLELSGKK